MEKKTQILTAIQPIAESKLYILYAEGYATDRIYKITEIASLKFGYLHYNNNGMSAYNDFFDIFVSQLIFISADKNIFDKFLQDNPQYKVNV